MTKDPVPPSVKAASAKYPVPPGLDDVLEAALAKNANIRTKTVGAFADAVGHAYGLDGDHRLWATTPQQELARQIAQSLSRIMAPKVTALDVAGDPFAAPPVPSTLPMRQPGADVRQAFDQPFPGGGDVGLELAGIPAAKPGWLLPVVVGLLALVVGGAVTLVVMMH
jgi:hypothetical protein